MRRGASWSAAAAIGIVVIVASFALTTGWPDEPIEPARPGPNLTVAEQAVLRKMDESSRHLAVIAEFDNFGEAAWDPTQQGVIVLGIRRAADAAATPAP